MDSYGILGIVGLPGSGKTWLAKELLKRMPLTQVIDDIRYKHQLPAKLKYNLIITDPFFCDAIIRNAAHDTFMSLYGVEIQWLFFEKNVSKCLKNIRYRQEFNRDVMPVFMSMAEAYEIPEGVKTRTIWDSDQS